VISSESPQPTITRTLAKGIAPRICSPLRKRSRKNTTSKRKSAQKRHRKNDSESGDEESEETRATDDSEHKPKGKKPTKRRRAEESKSKAELVDGAEPEPVVEEVEEHGPTLSGDDEVSTCPSLKRRRLTQH
jgi:hypothetical protein